MRSCFWESQQNPFLRQRYSDILIIDTLICLINGAYYPQNVYICGKYTPFSMKTKKQVLFPKHQKILEQLGENIKLARKRRKFTMVQVAERAWIDRKTLYRIEKGDPGVTLGAYFNVLRVLGLQDDFLKLAVDDEFGRKLQDLKLLGDK
jgi:DNA-binding XRE family transcriptional regulator